jgi:hypothetical protein
VSTLSSIELNSIIDRLLAAREHSLVCRSVQSILSSIDRVVQLWLDPLSEERREAEALLPVETSLSPEMIHHVLSLIFQEYRAERLEALLRDELGDVCALDEIVTIQGRRRKAYAPPLVTHVLAGNLPGAGLDGVIFSLLMKSATLVKASSSASLLPTLFSHSLAHVDPDLAVCLAVLFWPGGNAALEQVAFSRSDLVVASGSDESLAAIRQRVRGRFISYGHKVSFSVITKEALSDAADLARRAAYDVVLFDQRGCLSPQVVYVEEGGILTSREFATLLAQALEQWQGILPRGEVPLEVSTAIRRARDEAEWQMLAGKNVGLYASPNGTAWTVIYEADSTFVSSPLYRTLRVKPFASLVQLESVLVSWRSHLEAVGLAVAPERLPVVADSLGRAGVSRICPIGTMQIPPLSWRHGGRPRIADMIRWVEVEA